MPVCLLCPPTVPPPHCAPPLCPHTVPTHCAPPQDYVDRAALRTAWDAMEEERVALAGARREALLSRGRGRRTQPRAPPSVAGGIAKLGASVLGAARGVLSKVSSKGEQPFCLSST